MNNKIVVMVIGAIVLAGASFYGGMAYGKSSGPTRGELGNGQFMGRGQLPGGGGMGAGVNGGFTAGEIIAKDDSSITVKMQEGGTKIILMSNSTQVMKAAEGSIADLGVGINVTVTGGTNSDGSITAENVQIRPIGTGFPQTRSPQQ